MIKTILVVVTLLASLAVQAQKRNWQKLDLATDGEFGISVIKAKAELLKGQSPVKVTVAIIDSGVDSAHVALKNILWRNEKEVDGNGVDDDGNGYIDDIYGWNFIATEKGKEDLVNIILQNRNFYDSLSYTKVPDQFRLGYEFYRKIYNEYNAHVTNAELFLADLQKCKKNLSTIADRIGKPSPDLNDFDRLICKNEHDSDFIRLVIKKMKPYNGYATFYKKEIDEVLGSISLHLSHGLSLEDDGATDYTGNRYEQNNDISNSAVGLVMHPNLTPYHGTHVAGIIAASDSNSSQSIGIADDAKIMVLKVSSNIRELRDANLIEAIRYAVDNGARIINLSFGKSFSYKKKAVDDVVKYAMKKNVLIIHAAGNEGADLDVDPHFPNREYEDKTGAANAWIEVGASGATDNRELLLSFSNYGQTSVDVFAPGVDIYSTIPYNSYSFNDGTSMAAPVVSGLAALIMEYFPKLTAIQVKDIIMQSVVKRDVLKDKCVSGGVVNAYNALKLAATYK